MEFNYIYYDLAFTGNLNCFYYDIILRIIMSVKDTMLALTLFALVVNGYSQSVDYKDSSRHVADSSRKVRNIIGFVPSKATTINGWAVGWLFALDHYGEEKRSVRLNGLYTNIGPIQALVIAFSPAFISNYPKNILRADSIWRENIPYDHRLNGVSIGIFEAADGFSIQGLQLTGLFQRVGKMNGLSITGLASVYQKFNGIMISGIYNFSSTGNGIQLGLFNITSTINGIQIGLFNNSFQDERGSNRALEQNWQTRVALHKF